MKQNCTLTRILWRGVYWNKRKEAKGRKTLPLAEYNNLVDPRDNIALAGPSLEYNGIVSVERVLPEQIVDYVILEKDWRLMWIGADSAPIPMNYRFLGPQYCRYIVALFKGGIEAAFQMAQDDKKKLWGDSGAVSPGGIGDT